ncbi:MAG TPA: dihydroorotate dehydrogenase-like protein [Egicoccus sp.]|nr:dihydroorotate dehydrogenase-like protein [Egicoccus sp.]HSK24909.1 dihydroorotate dehydrogenase-like protein [Egicoccus sp.]
MDLSTRYLGLHLRSPLVASSGPFTGRIDRLRDLEDAGIAAVVLPSLFEEQVVHDELQTTELFLMGEGGNPEATGYFPDLADYETIADRYLRHLTEAKAALTVPVIASLNGSTPGGWTRYARLLEEAGADAIELNLYRVAADPVVSGADVEAEQLELVGMVRDAISIPLAVKVGPHYSAFAHMAQGLVAAGADGLVLFNRFYQPDLDPLTRKVVPAIELSTSSELRLPLRWTALLYGRVDASLAITTGVHTGVDAAKGLLAGADITMMTSALLRYGPDHISLVEDELTSWAEQFGATAISELRGSASHRNVRDPEGFERANYIGGLVDFSNTFASAQGSGPW